MGGYGMAAKMRELTEQNMQEFVKEVEKRKIPLHSVLIAQHGNLLFEKYYAPYCRNKLQRMFSVTKSFTSLAIGLLEQEGKISLQDPICDYFPEYLPGRSASLAGRDDDRKYVENADMLQYDNL